MVLFLLQVTFVHVYAYLNVSQYFSDMSVPTCNACACTCTCMVELMLIFVGTEQMEAQCNFDTCTKLMYSCKSIEHNAVPTMHRSNSCWPSASDQSFYRQIVGYERGVRDHKVGQ